MVADIAGAVNENFCATIPDNKAESWVFKLCCVLANIAVGVAPFESILSGSPITANSLNETFPAALRPGPYPTIIVKTPWAANSATLSFAASVSPDWKSPSPITTT